MNANIEGPICRISELDRSSCIYELTRFTDLRLDFTEDYLSSFSLERLRHTLLAAVLQANRGPSHRTVA